MCNTVCPYKCKCTSYPGRCNSCRRNTGKRDYYIPGRCHDWYTPHPWHPYTHPTYNPYPTWQYTWSTADNYTTPTTTSGTDNTISTWTTITGT